MGHLHFVPYRTHCWIYCSSCLPCLTLPHCTTHTRPLPFLLPLMPCLGWNGCHSSVGYIPPHLPARYITHTTQLPRYAIHTTHLRYHRPFTQVLFDIYVYTHTYTRPALSAPLRARRHCPPAARRLRLTNARLARFNTYSRGYCTPHAVAQDCRA